MPEILPYHLASLAQLCRCHPTARKVVFAPSAQGGRAVQQALAAAGVPSLNLQVTTALEHAAEWIPPEDLAEGRRPLPIFSEEFLLDHLLGGPARAGALPARLGALRETVEALRAAGLHTAEALDGAEADDPADEARLGALARLTRTYGEALARDGGLDDAETLRLAAARAEALGPPAGTVYAAFDEAAFSPLEARFVRALTGGGAGLHRIGFALPGLAPPPASAAARFWPEGGEGVPPEAGPGAWLGAAEPPEAAREAAARSFRFRWAVGAQAEVRDVLRDALARGLAWDEVEIAYTANDPYLALLHAEVAALEGLPATFAAGFPLRLTRTGHALRGLLDWLEQGREAAVLVRLLQGGLLAFRHHPEACPHRAAHALLAGGLGRGAGAHRAAVQRARTNLERKREKARGQQEADRLEQQIIEMEADLEALEDFAACLPEGPQPPAIFCRALREALRRFGPADPEALEARRVRGEHLSTDEFALDLAQRRLLDFAERAPATLAAPLRPERAARALREPLLAGFLRARAPRPGSLHIVPLSSAGLAGRPHLYIVGLDGATAAPAVLEDALLPDRDRERLDAEGAALPRAADAPRFQLYGFARALARVPAEGSVTACARTLDLAAGDALYPSSLLLRAADLAGLDLEALIEAPEPTGLVPEGLLAQRGGAETHGAEAPLALHDAEIDLAARRCPRPERERDLAARFPAAAQGLAAAEARASADLTPHDGWLGQGAAGLDFLGRPGPISPSRLETLAACPRRYFFQHVLGLKPPPEAPDPDVFLEPRERGLLLHEVFEAFGRRLLEHGRPARPEDEPDLLALTEEALEARLEVRGEPEAAVLEALRRDLRATARIFLQSEIATGATPHACEHRFGFEEPAEVRLGALTLRLRGIVDRIDRRPDGALEVVDFKTGSAWGFPEMDPARPAAALEDGKRLQWALYAFALEDAHGWRITHSGYAFPGEREWGKRRRYRLPQRDEVAEVIHRLDTLARQAFFPPAPGPACAFCDFARACGDTERLEREMKARLKEARENPEHPLAEALEAWSYR